MQSLVKIGNGNHKNSNSSSGKPSALDDARARNNSPDPAGVPIFLKRHTSNESASPMLFSSHEGDGILPSQHLVQRQATEEDDEEIIQTKPLIQRQVSAEEEEEEPIQTKLTVGAPDDEYEREADRVADKVMRMPAASTANPIDEEKEEGLTSQNSRIIQAKYTSSMYVQRRCTKCEVDQNNTPQAIKAPAIQRKQKNQLPLSSSHQVAKTIQSPHGGSTLPLHIQSRVGNILGSDLSHVKVHSDTPSNQAAQSLNAKAFTHGSNIFLAKGQSANDAKLMAHEVAHVVQQGAAVTPGNVQRAPGDEKTETKDNGENTTPQLTPADELLLIQYGIELADEDKTKLARLFPDGFSLFYDDVYITAAGDSVQSFRTSVIRAIDRNTLAEQAARVYFFNLESKGRSILVASSSGGESILLDVGVGQVRPERSSREITALVESLSNLVSSGQAAVPAKVLISHVDIDHYNAAREMLSRSAFSNMSIQIAMELISGRQAGKWTSMALNVDRNTRVIEVQVAGTNGAIHVNQEIYEGFELIEFRSVAAHKAAQSQSSYNKNKTAPVSVVIDRVTRERYIFSSDTEHRLFSEVIDFMGERAFKRLAGSVENLRLFEPPHHGGKVGTNIDARSMLRMLWFVMESSGGKADIVTQTSPGFAAKPSESLGFLELTGFEPRRIMAGNAPAGESQAERVTGAQTETITYNAEEIREVRELVRNNESDLRKGFQKQADINELRSEFRSAQRVMKQFEYAGSTKVADAIGVSLNELNQTRDGVRGHLRNIFSAMEAAAESSGMTRNANVTGVRAATGNMNGFIQSINLEAHKVSLNATIASMELHQRLMLNTVNILESGLKEDFGRMRGLRAERRQLENQARQVLGNKLVNEHIKKAWEAARSSESEQQSRVLQELLLRSTSRGQARKTAARIISGESLSRQLALHNLAEKASHGQLPSFRPIPVRTRVGAGFMAFLEVARMGLEFATIAKESSEASERWLKALELEGYSSVAWWTTRGAIPQLALITKSSWSGWNVVSKGFTQDQIQAMIDREINKKVGGKKDYSGENIPEMPEDARVVIDYVPDDQVVAIIKAQYLALNTLADFERWNNGYPGGPLFKKFGEEWGIRYWSEESDKYLYYKQRAIQQPLKVLMDTLTEGSIAYFQEMRENADDIYGIKDTALIFGTDRIVYVYDRYGRLVEYDFDSFRPRFVKVGTRWEGRKQYVVLQAADLGTYSRLSKTAWLIPSEGQRWQFYDYGGRPGVSYSTPWNPVYLNEWGYALAEEGDLLVELGHLIGKSLKNITP